MLIYLIKNKNCDILVLTKGGNMKKTSLRRNIFVGLCAVLCLALIVSISTTVAYLSSKRNTTGYLEFASGISIDYKNVKESSTSNAVGNLLYFNDKNNDGSIDDGELEKLILTNIMPSNTIKIANPKLSPKENTATFALRAKLVITDMSDRQNYVKYQTPEEITEFLNGSNKLFASGAIEFADNWEFNSADNYHYFVSAGSTSISERLIEIGYDNSVETQQEIYLFKGDLVNQNLVTITIIDGEPIEELPAKSVKIELFIEAIQYSAVENWNLG